MILYLAKRLCIVMCILAAIALTPLIAEAAVAPGHSTLTVAPQISATTTAAPPNTMSSRIFAEQKSTSWQSGWLNIGIILLMIALVATGPVWFANKVSADIEWWRNHDIVIQLALGFIFVVATAIGFLGIAATRGPTVPELGAYELVAFAALLVGVMGGFLFGVPKRGESSTESTGLRANTNLQQVSDWLVKIIVGVGLVEFTKVINGFPNFTSAIAGSIDGTPSPFTGLAGAIMVAFPTLGFFGGYLATVLVLSHEFALAEKELTTLLELGTTSLGSTVHSSSAQLRASEMVTAKALDSMTTPAQKLDWARAQVRLKNWNDAVKGYEAAGADASDDVTILKEYANALYHQTPLEPAKVIAPLQRALDRATTAEERAAVKTDLVRAELYLQPVGYESAIRHATELIADPSITAEPKVKLYRAAAYGAMYRNLSGTNDRGQLSKLKRLIEEDTDAAIADDGALLDQFRMMALSKSRYRGRAQKEAVDNHLEKFAEDNPTYLTTFLLVHDNGQRSHVSQRWPVFWNGGHS